MTKGVPSVPVESGGVILKPTARSVNPAKNWCFTWNNYPENWEELCVPMFQKSTIGYIIGKEVGKSGTPHLQGYTQNEGKIRPMTEYKLPKEIHWEAAKGNKAANILYCSKEEDYISWGTCKKTPPYSINIELFWWQKEIVQILEKDPDDRTIYWIWEEQGCAGKTTFQKWLFLKHKGEVAVLSGKASDMKMGIINFEEKNGTLPKIVLINIPRCQDTDHISWQGIEEIKDMFFFNGKYEGGMVCGPSPHVFLFSNDEAPWHKLSSDRWIELYIGSNKPDKELLPIVL